LLLAWLTLLPLSTPLPVIWQRRDIFGAPWSDREARLIADRGQGVKAVMRLRQRNGSCIGDRVWILPDGPAARRTSAASLSQPDTEQLCFSLRGERHPVPRRCL
jgi:hypothetical protein